MLAVVGDLEKKVKHDHFEDRLRLILNDGGFIGIVDDYYVLVLASEQSLVGSSGLNSEAGRPL